MTQTERAVSNTRYRSLDILKGIGIVYLIVLHQVIWLFTQSDGMGLRFKEAQNLVSFVFYKSGVHIFGSGIPLIAGASFIFLIHYKQPGVVNIFKRSLFLILAGFLMNIFAWGPYNIFDWDVLGFIGLATLFSYIILKYLPKAVAWSVFLFLTMVACVLSDKFPKAGNPYNFFYQIIFGDIQGLHYWPFFPWYALFVAGMFIGVNFLSENKNRIYAQIFLGCVLCLISLVTGNFFPPKNFDQIWGVVLFKPSFLFLFGLIGSILIFSVLFEFLEQKGFLKSKIFSIFEGFGKSVLWIYILTTVIGYNLTYRIFLKYFSFTFIQTIILFVFLIILHICISYGISYYVTRSKGRL